MDKVVDEAILLKRIDEVIQEISQATKELSHHGKDV